MFRAFLVGGVFSLIIGFVSPYAAMAIQYMGISADFITAGAIFCLLFVIGILNPILKVFKKPFNRREIVLIYSMMILASPVPCWALMFYLIPITSGLYYYATPENEWSELIHPHIRPFLAPQDKKSVIAFFEGANSSSAMQWKPWIAPFISWFIFIMVLYFVMICMMVIMRKQWVEHEKLTFPLTILPLEMTNESFFRKKLMWIGFSIAFLVLSLKGIHYYFPTIPQLNLQRSLSLYKHSAYLFFDLSFTILGFSYLVNLDVSLSLWLFYLLTRAELILFRVFNYNIPGGTPLLCGSSPMTTHQGMGAMIALVLFVIWMSRHHLSDVLRRVWKGERDGEAFSFRTAFFGAVLGLLFMGFFLWVSGLPYFVVPMFLFGAFAIFLSLTRIVAEGGVGFARPQCNPQPFVVFGIGSKVLGPQGLVALGLTQTWISDIRTIVMTSVLHGFKMSDPVKLGKRKIVQGALVAIPLSFLISYITIIRTGYSFGALNAQKTWFFHIGPVLVGREIATKLQHPVGKDIIVPRWIFTGLGAGFTFFLIFMRYRFLWWPVHYLGFPISDSWMTGQAWSSIFLGWLIKMAILRWGGLRTYRNMRPFFLGLILGAITCASMWLIIDAITGTKGNAIPIGVR